MLMVLMTVAGREAARELSVFQIMLMRSVMGLAMLWPLVHAAGDSLQSEPNACPRICCAMGCITWRSTAGLSP